MGKEAGRILPSRNRQNTLEAVSESYESNSKAFTKNNVTFLLRESFGGQAVPLFSRIAIVSWLRLRTGKGVEN
jgi:hypothetical protein